MTFDEWWQANYAETNVTSADRTFGEEVWSAAQGALLVSMRDSGPADYVAPGITITERQLEH